MPIGATAYGRAKQRHNTLANLNTANPVLAAGEIVAAIDGTDLVVRMGDGATAWTGLDNIFPHPETGGGGGGGDAFPIVAAETITNNLTGFQRTDGGVGLEGGIAVTSIVWDEPLDLVTEESVPWLTVMSGGQLGKLELSEEGWYDVRVMGYFTFPAGTSVTYLNALFTISPILTNAGSHRHWQGPVLGAAGEMKFDFMMSFGVIYSNGFALIQPDIRWNTGIVSATTARLKLSVTRLG